MKTLAILGITVAKMEKTRPVSSGYEELFSQMRGLMLKVRGGDIQARKNRSGE